MWKPRLDPTSQPCLSDVGATFGSSPGPGVRRCPALRFCITTAPRPAAGQMLPPPKGGTHTAEMMMARCSWPWNSSTDPTLMSASSTFFKRILIFSTSEQVKR